MLLLLQGLNDNDGNDAGYDGHNHEEAQSLASRGFLRRNNQGEEEHTRGNIVRSMTNQAQMKGSRRKHERAKRPLEDLTCKACGAGMDMSSNHYLVSRSASQLFDTLFGTTGRRGQVGLD